MTGAISWEQITNLIAIIGGGASLWWFLQRQITAGVRALDAYKLDAAEKFLKAEILREFEERQQKSEERFLAALASLTTRIDRLIDSKVS